jgi:predicted CXXCH cytochrome family protein
MKRAVLTVTILMTVVAGCSRDGATRFAGEVEPQQHFDQPCTLCHDDQAAVAAGFELPTCNGISCHPSNVTHGTNDPAAGTPRECLVCHTAHQSSNLFLVREEIDAATGMLRAVLFTNQTGLADGSYASASQPGSGVCEICHTSTEFYRADGTGAPHFTFTCTSCHEHSNGFFLAPPETPTISATPTDTATPVPPTATATVTPTPKPTNTAGGTPEPTVTPSVTQTSTPSITPTPGPADLFPTSLHALRTGMETFYSAANGGFETITDIPFDDLECRNCHAPTLADGTPVDPETYEPSCADCHANPGNPSEGITDALCFGCHSRQKAETDLFSDVHRDQLGFTCMSCHSTDEMHGDGNMYDSLLDTPGPQCETCHRDGGQAGPVPPNTAHSVHASSLDCSACHVQSTIACYNCHFDSEVAGAGKRFFAPPRQDFKFLLNFRGKVFPATFQALVFEQQSFYALAPYYAHTVTSSVRCEDCHGNAAITQYKDDGEITVTAYVDGELQGPSGVIPVPPDWETALLFDFLDYGGDASDPETDPALWQFLKSGADGTQLLYGEPLTQQQLDKLAIPISGR